VIRRSQSLLRALIAALFTYLLAGGATFNGVLFPELKSLTLGWVALLALAWLLVRWRRGWHWHRTALDAVVLLWIVSFTLSLLANSEIARRILIGLWYMGLYIGVWYILHDLIANKAATREMLLDGFLIGGMVVLYFAYRQLYSFLLTQPDLITALTRLPRPVGTIGNPNALGGLLVVLIPLVAVRLFTVTRRLARLLLAIYLLGALVLLVLSGSRGAWVGTSAGLAAWGLLFLAQRQLLSIQRLRAWWWTQSSRQKGVTTALIGLIVISGIAVGIVLVRSFSAQGRQLFLRGAIYEAAARMFTEKPLFGHGLFTFGRGLARIQSMPPETAHSHAHNVPLQIAAELGLVGIMVLTLTLIVLTRAMWRNCKAANGHNRTMTAGFIAAAVAFGVHHLTDIPAMMPAMALSGLLVLVLAVVPLSLEPVQRKIQQRLFSLGAVLLWGGLFATGYWSTNIYTEYLSEMRYASENHDFVTAAQRLQSVIDADPSLALYHLEQGELFGLAASTGDLDAASQGIAAYDRFIALEPFYAVAWANKGALQWQLGEQESAINTMGRAVDLAPRSWELIVNLGTYLDLSGNDTQAQSVYEQALAINPCALDHLNWERTPIKEELSVTWRETCLETGVYPPVAKMMVQVLDALEVSDSERAAQLIEQAARQAITVQDQAWLHLGRARLAQFDGDDITAQREIETARSLLEHGLLDIDYVEGINIAHSQYLRAAIQRLFLPQVYFPTSDPLLLRLIEET
jgi:O-antigen ligase/tetratricopeptide (TPR) repeat protein